MGETLMITLESLPFEFEKKVRNDMEDPADFLDISVVSDDDSEELREEVITKRFDAANDDVCITAISASDKIAQNSSSFLQVFCQCLWEIHLESSSESFTCSSFDSGSLLLISLKKFTTEEPFYIHI